MKSKTKTKEKKPTDWSKVRVPAGKTSIHVRIDSEVLDWFKSSGKGYQTLMNSVLRSYYEAQQA
jgi:uncharacterized protein (DUF4415 family)